MNRKLLLPALFALGLAGAIGGTAQAQLGGLGGVMRALRSFWVLEAQRGRCLRVCWMRVALRFACVTAPLPPPNPWRQNLERVCTHSLGKTAMKPCAVSPCWSIPPTKACKAKVR